MLAAPPPLPALAPTGTGRRLSAELFGNCPVCQSEVLPRDAACIMGEVTVYCVECLGKLEPAVSPVTRKEFNPDDIQLVGTLLDSVQTAAFRKAEQVAGGGHWYLSDPSQDRENERLHKEIHN